MTGNPGFQVSLDVMGRLCLVIGGDGEAAEKISRLLEAGAKMVVVNPTLNDTLRKLTASGKVIHRGRRFRLTDTQGVVLVLNTLREEIDLAKSLYELAKAERFLVWSIDQPEVSTFMMPAVVARGRLRLAISTSGASPALAGVLRQQCEPVFDENFVQFLDWLATLREELREKEPSEIRRREKLQEALDGFQLLGKLKYPKSWMAAMEKGPSTS